jgi:hypothetical protein
VQVGVHVSHEPAPLQYLGHEPEEPAEQEVVPHEVPVLELAHSH